MTVLKKQLVYVANLPKRKAAEILFANGGSAYASQTNYVDIWTAAGDGFFVRHFSINSNDSVAANVVVAIKRGGIYYPIGTVAVAANSGTNGTLANINMLGGSIITGLASDDQGNRGLVLETGDTLAYKVLVALSNTGGVGVRAEMQGFEIETGS